MSAFFSETHKRGGMRAFRAGVLFLMGSLVSFGSIIGTNPPAQSLTRERIAQLPRGQQQAWLLYLERSQKQRQADKEVLQEEATRVGIHVPTEPPHDYSARSMPLDRSDAWYGSAEARHIADVIVSFQTPAGGWGKNLAMNKELRQPGEAFTPNNLSHFLAPGDFDTPAEPGWNYVGTIDNDATTTQIRFLAKVIAAAGKAETSSYRASFARGINYLFNAQFPNGGWPQVWPLEGGYHDAITYNDDAMGEVMEILHDLAEAKNDFAFASLKLRRRAEESFKRGVQCILAGQIVSDGKRTAWPQQEDPLTLKPVSARNFEPPAQCTSESANLLLLLMKDLPHPSAEEQRAVRSAAAWFQTREIYGQSWQRTPEGRKLVPSPGAGPIWSRYVQIGSDRPIFGDRDKSIHDDVNELSAERRNGYRWYSADPMRALSQFKTWEEEHPEPR